MLAVIGGHVNDFDLFCPLNNSGNLLEPDIYLNFMWVYCSSVGGVCFGVTALEWAMLGM